MMNRIAISLMMFFICQMSKAQKVTLEDSVVSEKDKKEAQSVRDKTSAPDSLAVGAVKSMLQSASKRDYVDVAFDVISGFSTEGVDRVFSMRATEGDQRVVINGSQNGASIHKGSNGKVGGAFVWYAKWNKGAKSCSGSIQIADSVKNVNIRIYPDCRDAGTTRN